VSQQFEKVSRISCTTKFVRESFHNPFIFWTRDSVSWF
jgi:hypothetical protein